MNPHRTPRSTAKYYGKHCYMVLIPMSLASVFLISFTVYYICCALYVLCMTDTAIPLTASNRHSTSRLLSSSPRAVPSPRVQSTPRGASSKLFPSSSASSSRVNLAGMDEDCGQQFLQALTKYLYVSIVMFYAVLYYVPLHCFECYYCCCCYCHCSHAVSALYIDSYSSLF